ncbi:pentapeptide repeat-containing protein [Micromonospora sp. NPDC048999]|uniref:pentapeptide repeat-containing protein n=1 Tax=Micromonospora sp. NPDC048999 TaxID=3155391 RepID=UPI0033C41338
MAGTSRRELPFLGRVAAPFRSEVVRENLTLAVAAVALTLSIVSTVNSCQAMERSDQQQRADRLASAATLLSSDVAGARVAGVRAMLALADDFQEERPTVLDLLSAHVAGQAARREAPPKGEFECPRVGRDFDEALSAVTKLYAPQRALDIKEGRAPYRLELSGVCLLNAKLADANLEFADLTWARLDGADLSGARLSCADFTGAFLQNTVMRDTQLHGANFSLALVKKTSVDFTGIIRTDLRNATFTDTSFVNETAEPLAVNADRRGATWLGATIGPKAHQGKALPGGFDAFTDFDASKTNPNPPSCHPAAAPLPSVQPAPATPTTPSA